MPFDVVPWLVIDVPLAIIEGLVIDAPSKIGEKIGDICYKSSHKSPVVKSEDPNEIVGPEGISEARYVAAC